MKKIFAVILALALLAGFSALADGAELKVTGSGTVYIQADRASASLGVNLSGEDLGELQQRANNAVAAVIEALKAAGLDEQNIATNYIYISPRYDYSSDVERLVGYSINNSMTITTDQIDNIGTYIDAAFAAGANTFDSINFSVSDDTEARKQALELAVQDAQRKAKVIAAAAGVGLQGIEEIVEGTQNDYYYNTASGGAKYAVAETAAADAGTTVRAAQVNVTATVQVTYGLVG